MLLGVLESGGIALWSVPLSPFLPEPDEVCPEDTQLSNVLELRPGTESERKRLMTEESRSSHAVTDYLDYRTW